MKGSQAELIGFLTRFSQAFTDGGCPPAVRVIRKKKMSAQERLDYVFSNWREVMRRLL